MRRDKDYSVLRELATQATILVSGLLPPGYLCINIVLDNSSLYMSTALSKDDVIKVLRELLEKIDTAKEKERPPYEH